MSAATAKDRVTNLQEQVGQSNQARKLLARGQSLLIAVSGGVDSMVLLHVLHALAARHRWKLSVAHFNHQLRGRSSDADERLVRQTAKGLGVSMFVGRGEVKSLANRRGLSIEMAARELRHEYLARTARRLKIRTVALAHHADDQVELFFLRVLRGAGSEGLAGMKWRSPSPAAAAIQLIRPLLDVSRAELEQFARENKIRFREDTSNADRDFLRNRIRHDLLPWLRRHFQPAVNQTVRRLMEIVGAEAEVVSLSAKNWLEEKHRSPFAALPVAIQRRVIQLQLQQQSIAADFDLIESLRGDAGRLFNVRPQVSVSRDAAGRIRVRELTAATFNSQHLPVSLDGGAGKVVFADLRFQWRSDAARRFTPQRRRQHCEVFDADKIGDSIVLRHWQPGDRFQPIGMKSPVKLQDWFTNRKIPRARRHELVVATTGAGQIFWVEGQRIAELFKLTARSRKGLIWHWRQA